ncbi:2-hydroxyisoflavanone dehydratase, partial [Nicotiana attenuata]
AMRAGRNKGSNKNVIISSSIFVCPYLVPLENIEQGISYKNWITISPPSEDGIHSPMINPLTEKSPCLSINPLTEKSPCLSGLGCSRLLFCIGEKDEYVPSEIGIQFFEGMFDLKKSGWRGDLEFIEVEGEGHCFQLVNPEAEKSQDLIKRLASFIQNK